MEKIQVQLKSDKSNGYLHEDICRVMIISHSVLLRMRKFSGKNLEQIKTHISCSLNSPTPENRVVYEKMGGQVWYSNASHR